MEIKLNTNLDPVPPPAQGAPQRTRDQGVTRDGVAFSKTEAINKALEAAPNIRPEKVAAGKLLMGDVHYPPQDIINRIANLLAISID